MSADNRKMARNQGKKHLPVLARISRFTDKAILMHVEGSDDPIIVAQSVSFVQPLVILRGSVKVLQEVPASQLTDSERTDLLGVDSIVWVPQWKVTELCIDVMGPAQ